MSPSGTDFDGFGSAPTLAAAPAPILPLLLDPPQPAILQRCGGVAQPVNLTKKKCANIAASKAFRDVSDSRIFKTYVLYKSPVSPTCSTKPRRIQKIQSPSKNLARSG